MVIYPKPTDREINLVKKLYALQNQVKEATSIGEIKIIVNEVIETFKNEPTGIYQLSNGQNRNGEQMKQNMLTILTNDVELFSTVLDTQFAVVVSINLVMGLYVFEIKELLNILNQPSL